MRGYDIFKDPTKALPKKDEQIVRIPFEQQEIAGRTGHIPSPGKSGPMTITHVPNSGSKH